jgi:quinol monooxygenase YgiN
MIHVLATIELNPGCRAEFLAVFAWLTPLVHAEDGCIEYGPAVDMPTPIAVQVPPRENVVLVVEKWSSIAALQTHLGAPHMAEYRERVKPFVKGVSLQILEPALPG